MFLHLTQPILSHQPMYLEEELDVKLLNCGNRNRHITLSEEGMLLLLRRHAEVAERLDYCMEKGQRYFVVIRVDI